jgi:hypothetical protein
MTEKFASVIAGQGYVFAYLEASECSETLAPVGDGSSGEFQPTGRVLMQFIDSADTVAIITMSVEQAGVLSMQLESVIQDIQRAGRVPG